LAVAPTKGIVVGAGPDSLAISSSEAVRKAISAPSGEDKVKTKPFEPQATIPLPARPTHAIFASSDSALVVATENGAQLAVYDTSTLLQGNAQPALAVPTNGVSFRAVVPNPAPSGEVHSSLVALITTGGDLLIADLKTGNLVSGPNGNILKNGVSSVCWSNKGKALVAGLADGSGYQMTPEGVQKDQIPRPADLEENCHGKFATRAKRVEILIPNYTV
jgi:nucleoporin NUP159